MNVSGCVDVWISSSDGPSVFTSQRQGGTLDQGFFVRALLLFALTCHLALATPDVPLTEVPESRSPEGKFALYYKPPQQTGDTVDFSLYFCDKDGVRASQQLIPDLGAKTFVGGPGDLKAADDFETQTLLSQICLGNEFHLRKQLFDPAFSYSVTWTFDTRWVVIEGGAHKFWHMAAYRRSGDQFLQIDLSHLREAIARYLKAHQSNSSVQQLGVEQKVKAIRHRNYDWAYVGWLGDGVFAVDGYPFLLNDPDYGSLRATDGEVYFVVNCSDPRQPTVTGMAH
jgi:hypothetical protein